MTIRTLSLTSIRIDGDVQPRVSVYDNVIEQYRVAMETGATFPPVVVFHDGKRYWLADGFHRYHAAVALRRKSIDADVREGTKRDAILHAVGANATHGLPRSNADKRRSVLMLLSDEEWSKWSDREIARRCCVSPVLVADLKKLTVTSYSERTYTTKHGTVATMNVAGIGKRPAPDHEASDEVLDVIDVEALFRDLAEDEDEYDLFVMNRVLRYVRSAPDVRQAVHFQHKSYNEKLTPVARASNLASGNQRASLIAKPPFVCTTTVSIKATCPDCVFKGRGCYAQVGSGQFRMSALDAAGRAFPAEQVIAEEARRIDEVFADKVPQDGARGGRDLRLHVAGDAPSVACAWMLAGAAKRWRERGGGSVWTYTHAWREVPREAWGTISVLASVEKAEDIEAARERGYPAALVVEDFPGDKAFPVEGSRTLVIPCPAETKDLTCVQCRLCLDRDLLKLNRAIAFKLHGQGEAEALAQLRRANGATKEDAA